MLEVGELTLADGLVGDRWAGRAGSRSADGSPALGRQLTLMGARTIARIAGRRERWPLAGDQLFVDLDLSLENLPPGTRLAIGEAEIEITDKLHAPCAKFQQRFGMDAVRVLNSPAGR